MFLVVNAVALGVGIGIGVGVPVVIALIVLIVCIVRRKSKCSEIFEILLACYS